MSRTIRRYDRDCRDVTNMPGLWSETDCEILQTRYSDPGQTNGIKTNGPPLIFIRLPDCDDHRQEWIFCDTRSLHKALDRWHVEGFPVQP
jgi:hypothetical protein